MPADPMPHSSCLETFIRTHTVIGQAPFVPELSLHLATDATSLWEASEAFLQDKELEPPFWAFAWPGSQLIARTLLDRPRHVQGKRVLDVACGCGLAGIAAARSGATRVMANDIDPMAMAAARLNADLNHAYLHLAPGDLVGTPPDYDLMVVGDVCYDLAMATRFLPWLTQCAQICEVWLCDPGRHYGPQGNRTASNIAIAPGLMTDTLEIIAQESVPTLEALESASSRITTLYRLPGPRASY